MSYLHAVKVNEALKKLKELGFAVLFKEEELAYTFLGDHSTPCQVLLAKEQIKVLLEHKEEAKKQIRLGQQRYLERLEKELWGGENPEKNKGKDSQ